MLSFSPLNLRSKNLFKRCVTCNALTSASCPVCSSGQDCTLTPATCDRCAEYTCVAAAASGVMPGLTPSSPVHRVPVAPVIAGAVIGGCLLIATIVWLIWKFVLKGRRHDPVPDWDPAAFPMEKSGQNSPHAARSILSNDARSRTSTHTYRSMASTVLTRASNVIQIAFIPGVTTRSSNDPSTTPRTLVPPVPPIPLPTSPLNKSMRNSEDTDDLHPGQYSTGTRGSGSRNSVASSVSPSVAASLARGSIASTMYGGSAVAVTPIKPSIVSVKSLASSPHTSMPPPMPSPNARAGSSDNQGGKSMIVQMPVSREKGDLSKMPPSRVRSLRGLKPKAVMIAKNKNAAAAAAANASAASPQLPTSAATTPSLATPGSTTLTTLPEESKQPSSSVPAASSTLSPNAAGDTTQRPDSAVSADSHSRAHSNTEDSDAEDDHAADEAHERSRQSLVLARNNSASGPFSDAAAIPTSPRPASVQSSADPDAIKEVKRASESHLQSPFSDSHEMQ